MDYKIAILILLILVLSSGFCGIYSIPYIQPAEKRMLLETTFENNIVGIKGRSIYFYSGESLSKIEYYIDGEYDGFIEYEYIDGIESKARSYDEKGNIKTTTIYKYGVKGE